MTVVGGNLLRCVWHISCCTLTSVSKWTKTLSKAHFDHELFYIWSHLTVTYLENYLPQKVCYTTSLTYSLTKDQSVELLCTNLFPFNLYAD